MLISGIVFAMSFLFFKLEGRLERLFLEEDINMKVYIEEKKSLPIFRYTLRALCLLNALEFHCFDQTFSILSILIICMGVLFRLMAIKGLGKYWSFNIKVYEGHEMIKDSIYRYMRHPGYVGNMYIVGFFLFFGSNYTAMLSSLFLILFGCWRANRENVMLSSAMAKCSDSQLIKLSFAKN